MGENQGIENGDVTQGQNDNGTSNVDDTANQGHPAWQEILDILPESLYPVVTPALEKWDKGVQTRFQNLQQQYEPWKPYVENDVDPQFVQQALGIASAIENEPAKILAAMQEAYPDVMAEFLKAAGASQGVVDTGSSGGTEDDDDPYEARFAQHEQMMEKLAETFLADVEANESRENQEALDEYLSALGDSYGDFDETFVLTQMANGMDGEEAVKAFQGMVKNYGGNVGPKQQTNPAPTVMSASGGLPSNRTDPRTMGDADAQALVREILKAANES